jgi:hypothetical protein
MNAAGGSVCKPLCFDRLTAATLSSMVSPSIPRWGSPKCQRQFFNEQSRLEVSVLRGRRESVQRKIRKGVR